MLHSQELNPSQDRAVRHTDGPLMVLAGPGTGKTRVVTQKIKHLVDREGYRPDQILALTFSNKAAGEMEERVRELLPGVTGFQISTFHSFCNEVVRTHTLELGLDGTGAVITDNFQKAFLLDRLDKLGLEHFKVPHRPVELATTFQGTIARFKQENITVDRLEDYLAERKDTTDDEHINPLRDLARAYRAYEQFKQAKRLQDFADMQLYTLRLFQDNPRVLEAYRQRLRYLIIDEFQDTDLIQLRILLLLAPYGNITVVADDDQSIYRFRGAYSTNMREFRDHYQRLGLKVAEQVLNVNYRCTGNLQAAATALIANNAPGRSPKEISTAKAAGEPVRVTHYLSDWEQAKGLTSTLLELNRAGTPWQDMAILVRRRIDSVPIIENLHKAGVPMEIIGAREYFREPVVSAVVAYLRTLADPHRNQPALGQLMLRPVHGLVKGDIPKLSRYARDRECSLWEALGDLSEFPGDTTCITGFKEELDRLFHVLGDEGLLVLVRAVLFGKDLFRIEIEEHRRQNIRLLNRFLELTTEFLEVYPAAGLPEFLLHLEALADLRLEEASEEAGQGCVHLMTVHGSKGKEFPVVFVPCLNRNRFPSRFKPFPIQVPVELRQNLDPQEDPIKLHRQEERRLCYVALTRARERAYLSCCKMYGTNKRPTPPSVFLEELNRAPQGCLSITERTDEADEFQERLSSVESAIASQLYSTIQRGDWRQAQEAMTALAKQRGMPDTPDLPLARDLDLDEYIERLNVAAAEPAREHLRDIVYSPSRLAVYEKCPRQYYYSHVLLIPGVQKTFFGLGTVLHDIAETLGRKQMEGQAVTLEQARDLLAVRWRPSVYESRSREREDRQLAERMLEQFMARQASKTSRILDVERWVELDLEGRKVRGKVDRIEDLGDTLQVIDYKTSKNKTSWPQLRQDFQMALYHLGVEAAFNAGDGSRSGSGGGEGRGKPVSEVGHWYLRHDQERMVSLSTEELQAVKERALEVIRGIEAGRFEATPDYQACRWCDYMGLCGEGG